MTGAMVTLAASGSSREQKGLGLSGLVMFLVVLGILAMGIALVVFGIAGAGLLIPLGFLVVVLGLFVARGLFIIQPNESEVLVLFGKYRGTVREAGWYWTNPLSSRKSISLRLHNFNTPQLKVNDLDGNPIEIAAVVSWRVVDTARASFDVENYAQFVQIQSETALRHVAGKFPYDITQHPDAPSLRGASDQVLRDLTDELQARLDVAGIQILDARLTHLAYSSEIAGAMLQRQQATAILAARRTIVQGAVGMVEDVIKQLEERGVLSGMSGAERAHMASALLVVLTSDRGAQPVVTTA